MKHHITISDADLLSMDDNSGDISLSIDSLPTIINVGEEVEIAYKEDSDNIIHIYKIIEINETDKTVTLEWVEQIDKSILTESPVIKLDDSDLVDPAKYINFKDKVKQAAEKERIEAQNKERADKESTLKKQNEPAVKKLQDAIRQGNTTEEILEMLFEMLVPESGPSESVAGELVRAIMRIMYRDLNDGDKFFESYGLETCGGSAEYLFNNGFDEDIQNILNDAVRLSENDDAYTDAVTLLGQNIIEELQNNDSLFWELNEDDSREYTYNYIFENQPTYEFELYGSDDIYTLVDKGVLDSWDLIRYVEGQLEWESAYRNAEVARPWSHHDTSVTVTDLTRDGYDLLESNFNHNPEGWWQDLTSNYADELSDSDYDDDYEEDSSYEDAE